LELGEGVVGHGRIGEIKVCTGVPVHTLISHFL
jgi:hypothetical protein